MIIIVVSAITSEAPTDMKFYYQWRSNFSLKTFTSGHCKRYRVAQGWIRCGHDSMHRRPCGTYALNPVALCDTQRAVTLITKSEIPSTKSGIFFGLAFFLMLIYRELNFDTDCFNAYVTSCSYTITRTSSEWSTKDLVRVANYSICSLGLTDMLCIATLQLTAIDNDNEVGL